MMSLKSSQRKTWWAVKSNFRMIEIERKFLLRDTTFLDRLEGTRITQGYLSTDPLRTVRVRVKGAKGFLTIKGVSNDSGLSRYEWEKELPLNETLELLKLALPTVIDKTRYEVMYEEFLYEVDVFHGANKGLIMAELELTTESQQYPKPPWLGEEVTSDKRFYNSYLSENPFNAW